MDDYVIKEIAVNLSHKQTVSTQSQIFGISIPVKKLVGSGYCFTEQ